MTLWFGIWVQQIKSNPLFHKKLTQVIKNHVVLMYLWIWKSGLDLKVNPSTTSGTRRWWNSTWNSRNQIQSTIMLYLKVFIDNLIWIESCFSCTLNTFLKDQGGRPISPSMSDKVNQIPRPWLLWDTLIWLIKYQICMI